jgi:hypothetical protein
MRTHPILLLLGSLVCACPSEGPLNPVPDGGGTDGGDAAATPTWHAVLSNLDGALLSIWGSSPTDIYSVGGPLGNAGFTSLVVHYDGMTWKRLEPGGTETYWWVSGTGANDVWMSGEKGRITHYDGAAFKEHTPVTTATLYGIWAASPTDVWAVGGTPEGGTAQPNDIVLHYDGVTWTKQDLPQPAGIALFKVWGTSSEDLYAVGERATVWHRGAGGTWTLQSNPPVAHGTLLTVFGCNAAEVYAVGGRDVLRSDGKTWSPVNVALTNDVNGVSCGKPGAVVLVGFGGSKQRLVAGEWINDFGTEPFSDLHGAWADSTGTYWAAGGNFVARPAPGVSRSGVVARYGL